MTLICRFSTGWSSYELPSNSTSIWHSEASRYREKTTDWSERCVNSLQLV